MEIHSEFTSKSLDGLSPWNNINNTFSSAQLNLAYNPISKIEVVSSINLHNLGRGTLYYYDGDHTNKYNPKIYLGVLKKYIGAMDL